MDDVSDQDTLRFTSEVEFISHAAADEFLYRATQDDLKIDLSEASSPVRDMFTAVRTAIEHKEVATTEIMW